MVWVPVLDLAALPRVVGMAGGGGAVADGLVLGVGGEVVVGHRMGEGGVVGSVYRGESGVGVGDRVDAGSAVGEEFLGVRSGSFVGMGLEIGGIGEVFLRNRGGGSSPTLLKRPLPGVDDGGATGFKIEPLDESSEARKP